MNDIIREDGDVQGDWYLSLRDNVTSTEMGVTFNLQIFSMVKNMEGKAYQMATLFELYEKDEADKYYDELLACIKKLGPAGMLNKYNKKEKA